MDPQKYKLTRQRIAKQGAAKTDVRQQNGTLGRKIKILGIAENAADTDQFASTNKLTAPGVDVEKAERAAIIEQIALLEWKSHLGRKSRPLVWKPRMQHADMPKLLQRKYKDSPTKV